MQTIEKLTTHEIKKKKKWPVQKMSKSMTMDMKEGVRQ